jgi:hypothetical protein
MPRSDADPSQSPPRPRAALHVETAAACLADRGILEIAIAHLIAAREAQAPALRLQTKIEETKLDLRLSIQRFERVRDHFAAMKLLGLLYALDPTLETLTFMLERLRATEQWDMANVVQRMVEAQRGQPV